jgi:hypothetical protein
VDLPGGVGPGRDAAGDLPQRAVWPLRGPSLMDRVTVVSASSQAWARPR